ncbi:putative aspartic protease At2g35615 [Curcuma longa]|uniref:putative aspartic protease At2g35615 n=1 Tax=Curcuma longa TaxID=136217 RepID=UPI003D9EB2B2
MAAISISFLLLLISFAAFVTPTTATAGTVFDMELVHRDSPKSPLYNSSLTPFDRLQAAALRSVNRASYLATRIAMKTSLDIDLGLRFDAEFLMGFSMGSPNLQAVWGIVDTGSDLNWVNCVGCQCFNRTATLFNASASLSYKTVTCYSDECSSLGRGFCTEDETCQYHYAYGDGSNIDGLLSTDTFRLHSVQSNQFTFIPNMVFGCNFRSLSTAGDDLGSLIGLGPRPPSLIHQLAPKYISKYFSYCLNQWVEAGLGSRLFLGRGNTTITGTPTVTRLMTQDGYYAVQLNSISIPGVFDISLLNRRSHLSAGGGNIIFDSGTVLTMLDNEVVDELVRELTFFVKLPMVKPTGPFKLCFVVRSTEQEETLPGLWFGFDGKSGNLRVGPEKLFVWFSRFVKCMVITGVVDKIQIFGHMTQQNFMVGHDLEKMELSIIEKDCTKMNPN